MDDRKLEKALQLKKEIEILDKWFDYFISGKYTIKFGRKRGKLFLLSCLNGKMETLELKQGELKNKILKAIGQELDKVEKEYELL